MEACLDPVARRDLDADYELGRSPSANAKEIARPNGTRNRGRCLVRGRLRIAFDLAGRILGPRSSDENAYLVAALHAGWKKAASPSATVEYRTLDEDAKLPRLATCGRFFIEVGLWCRQVLWIKGTSMPRQLLWIGYCTLVNSLLATACFAIPDHSPTRDADHGRTLVNRWCVSCHLVGTDQKQATTDAPPFATIAKKSDFDAAKLAFFLLDPHPKMPDMQLSRDETSDIAAYIATLK
jgi:mono/diheme cytochrome c family protein